MAKVEQPPDEYSMSRMILFKVELLSINSIRTQVGPSVFEVL